ncbi:hypothetical protein ACJ41O_002567 [Fusarium nematophilum]
MANKTDIVLLGATGYTGRLTAAYMAKAIPETISWAIAGRNRAKLADLQEELQKDGAKLTVYDLDLDSDTAIAELAQSSRVIINTIGPYFSTCGSAVIKACAESGTDYIIMTAGWGAVPADLAVYLAARTIRTALGLSTREVLVSLDDVRGSFSGGSINSMCDLLTSYGAARIAASSAPFALSPVPRSSSSSIAKVGVFPAPNVFGVQVVKELGSLVESSQAQIETGIVGRSWGLFASQGPDSLGADGYGRDFFFSSRIRLSSPFVAWAFRAGYVLLIGAITKIPPLRNLVTKRLFPPGTGPSEEARQGHYFRYRAIAVAEQGAEGRRPPRVEVRIAYQGDPYVFTGVSLTEAALLLLDGGTPAHRRGGVLTPATLGQEFAERLKQPRAGVKIDVNILEDA